jgi:glycosyltransferase involved in cell wall biosynthesis
MTHPLVSIITVCYNAENTLENTIQSVIGQTYTNIEYIIIDGGSSDGTTDIIKKFESFPITWITENDKGVYDAMNKGSKIASGEWINFMNSGDTFINNEVLCKLIPLFNNEIISVIYGDTHVIEDFAEYDLKANKLSNITLFPPFSHQASFIRKKVLDKNLIDINIKISADRKLFYNLYIKGFRFEYCDKVIVNYDITHGSLSGNNPVLRRKEDIIIMKNESIKTKLRLLFDLYLCILKLILKRLKLFKIFKKNKTLYIRNLKNNPLITNLNFK